jgi:hypothetical protein
VGSSDAREESARNLDTEPPKLLQASFQLVSLWDYLDTKNIFP